MNQCTTNHIRTDNFTRSHVSGNGMKGRDRVCRRHVWRSQAVLSDGKKHGRQDERVVLSVLNMKMRKPLCIFFEL